MSLYAIGDVQGCQTIAQTLVETLTRNDPQARFIFVGDLVNRGPQSLHTLRMVKALGEHARVLLGNHDLHLFAVAAGLRAAGKSDTIREILEATDRDDLIDWLRKQPLALRDDTHLFVHAGVLPQWSAQQTLDLAADVEAVLAGPDHAQFLAQMYGNAPARWDDSLRGADRLRCIVNALTRIRYCSADGTMSFDKSGNNREEAGLMPWFDVPGRQTEDVTVVFGHWSQRGLVMRPNLIGLDTGCVWGGKLTAVNLSDRTLTQVPCPQYQMPGGD